MVHMDKASVEQRALINKLADEYADELNNLGVRVSALENRVGNVKLTGDARIHYRYQDGSKENDNSWDYRVRVRANAQVNDRTKVTYGISSDNKNFADNAQASDETNDIYTDIAKVDYNFGGNNWNLSVGRTDAYVLGNAYGYNYGDVFDRAELKYQNDKFAATAGYGKFKANSGDVDTSFYTKADGKRVGTFSGNDDKKIDGVKTGYGELEGFFGGGRAAGSALGVYYNDFTVAGSTGAEKAGDCFGADDLWGAYASLNYGKWNLLGNYEKVSTDNATSIHTGNKVDDPDVWMGKLTYGHANIATPKSWDVWIEYLNAEDGAFVGGNSNSWRFDSHMDNIESWGVGADYTFAKNAMFQVMQSFGTNTKDGNAKDPEEQTRAQFVFVF